MTDALEKVGRVLDALPADTRVGVVTLLGSLCPITLGHVQAFVEARLLLLGESSTPRPARLEPYGAVVGFISLNGDRYVSSKLKRKGEEALTARDRQHLVELAAAPYPWLGWEAHEGASVPTMAARWPKLRFVHYTMNGADDVAKNHKWNWAGPNSRFITMGRPGDTHFVAAGMASANISSDDGFCILGPELPDISSTDARRAVRDGDAPALRRLLNPQVAAWCLANSPWRPGGGSAAIPKGGTGASDVMAPHRPGKGGARRHTGRGLADEDDEELQRVLELSRHDK